MYSTMHKGAWLLLFMAFILLTVCLAELKERFTRKVGGKYYIIALTSKTLFHQLMFFWTTHIFYSSIISSIYFGFNFFTSVAILKRTHKQELQLQNKFLPVHPALSKLSFHLFNFCPYKMTSFFFHATSFIIKTIFNQNMFCYLNDYCENTV